MPYKDPEQQRKASRESSRRRRDKVNATVREQRAKLADYIAGKKAAPCTDCGQIYPHYVMDFDHVRGKKVMGVAKMAWERKTISAIDEEIAKCDLVCSNCHRVRTHERGYLKTPMGH